MYVKCNFYFSFLCFFHQIIFKVLQEAESRDRNSIGPQEFRNIMSRSPDFGVHFTLSFE